jgi:hypothetical protein
MEDRKHRPARPDTLQTGERRRLSRIVHDHKGNATVEWHDAPADYERQVFEIEGEKKTATSKLAGSLSVKSEDTFNPYARTPEADQKRSSSQRTDLRKLSAWIKMMRALEEAKKRDGDDDD